MISPEALVYRASPRSVVPPTSPTKWLVEVKTRMDTAHHGTRAADARR